MVAFLLWVAGCAADDLFEGGRMNNFLKQARGAAKNGVKRAVQSKAKELQMPQDKMVALLQNSKRFRFLLWMTGCTVDDFLKEDE